MFCVVADFFCKALCCSYNVAFQYREMGCRKFKLGLHRKKEEGRKSVERRKSENSSLRVSLPIGVYFNRPAGSHLTTYSSDITSQVLLVYKFQSRFNPLDPCSYHFLCPYSKCSCPPVKHQFSTHLADFVNGLSLHH